LLNDRVPTGRD